MFWSNIGLCCIFGDFCDWDWIFVICMYDVLEELFKICLWEVVFEVVLSCRLVENSSLWGLLVFMYRFVILFIFGV